MKTKTKKTKWNSGIAPKSTMSYEQYMKSAIGTICHRLSIRTYKLAPKKEYPTFERGKDIRVHVYWDKESKYEFIVEYSFWCKTNNNKEDREWMRQHADIHLQKFDNAVTRKNK
jgi:hypothetical protein